VRPCERTRVDRRDLNPRQGSGGRLSLSESGLVEGDVSPAPEYFLFVPPRLAMTDEDDIHAVTVSFPAVASFILPRTARQGNRHPANCLRPLFFIHPILTNRNLTLTGPTT